MPTYEYKCNDCEHTFEKLQPMNSENITVCPKCGKTGKSIEKLISAGAGIIFKGTGFYSTDYKKETKQKENMPNPPSCGSGNCGCS